MERLLVLRLESRGVAAEASLNGLPLARTPRGGGCVLLPVHEYTLSGGNRLSLQIEPEAPPDTPRLFDEPAIAQLQLLLPRLGQPASPDTSRSLGELAWGQPAGEPFRVPLRLDKEVELPVKFPRWRWLDAPPLLDVDALKGAVARFLQEQALALSRGDAEPFIQAARLRFEELALAYQRPLDGELARWRSRVQLLNAQKALRPPLPLVDELRLRAVADGRLIECRHADGGAALRCARPDGSIISWPLRLAFVESRFYVLR